MFTFVDLSRNWKIEKSWFERNSTYDQNTKSCSKSQQMLIKFIFVENYHIWAFWNRYDFSNILNEISNNLYFFNISMILKNVVFHAKIEVDSNLQQFLVKGWLTRLWNAETSYFMINLIWSTLVDFMMPYFYFELSLKSWKINLFTILQLPLESTRISVD